MRPATSDAKPVDCAPITRTIVWKESASNALNKSDKR